MADEHKDTTEVQHSRPVTFIGVIYKDIGEG